MNYRTILSLSLLALTLFFSGCGSSPNAKIYILDAMDRDSSISALTPQGQGVAVKVGPVSISDVLDQLQIVSRSGENSLIVDEFNRWGGDFQSDIQRVIGENISILLPTDQVILSQEIGLLPIDYQVLVNIREFDGTLGGMVNLNADWTVAGKGKDKSIVTRKSVLEEQADGAGYDAYVAAQSRLLKKLSQDITAEIRNQLAKERTRNNLSN
ncbi:MAG: membrane integrity-associated transporter subunit PqiC [Candidatus Methanofishera endochildressiae]|uniref:Membrane integrity-associated transporter subunit PqiC n=1 Tax=Candidatus Methanofishera endochildressiae TaxID=2738884 RepID=A0A7Z0MPC2_9GAMM|nr:membrane integrity-associated transporter subunit PqiC [Candidatus Methanofishera endochildressiae]